MFLSICLILMPAAVLSLCGDEKAVWQFFSLLDENGDGKILKTELTKLFQDFDTNMNGIVTIAEITAKLPDSAPDLKGKGRGQAIVDFFDPGKGREITAGAADTAFYLCDTNKDKACSKQEYQTLLKNICGPE